VPARRLPSEPHQTCNLLLPNGARIEFSGALDHQGIRSIITSAGTLAHLAANKYINGMPLYRQEAEFKRLDIPLTRSTKMYCKWIRRGARYSRSRVFAD